MIRILRHSIIEENAGIILKATCKLNYGTVSRRDHGSLPVFLTVVLKTYDNEDTVIFNGEQIPIHGPDNEHWIPGTDLLLFLPQAYAAHLPSSTRIMDGFSHSPPPSLSPFLFLKDIPLIHRSVFTF